MEKSVQGKDSSLNVLFGRTCLAPPWGFADRNDEELYAAYTQRQRQRGVPRLLVAGALLHLYVALVPGDRWAQFTYTFVAVGLAFHALLAIMWALVRITRPFLTPAVWFVLWLQIVFDTQRRCTRTFNELLGWAVLFQYFIIVTIPFNYILLMAFSLLSILGFLEIQWYNAMLYERRLPDDFWYQLLANAALLFGATFLGGMSYMVAERQQRNSFQETKRSLRDKLTIEQQSEEQERLLLSVLPEHVAIQMREDLGLIDTQFKKIYMSRHENVSILYADIVGFTAISSTYSAQDLVAILNELFARFDRLSEKYKQLRIKILGDCYYCISGAPVERPDHAVLCVHMGLSMVKAIKYVQQTTNSPVDMRVGIHTGAVLAGVLGQRQWQFDVYSRDVELANKMESSGLAGRVHISEVTLSYLHDEFEVEPAHGERREEMLRQAGIKTYFIVRVLKPYPGDEKNLPEGEGEGGEADALSDLRDDDEDSVLSPQDERKDNEDSKILSMLKEELVNRDDDRELADSTTVWLTFLNKETEDAYRRREDPCPLGIVATPLLLLPTVAVLASFAVPPAWSLNAVYLALVLETGLVNVIYYAWYRYAQYKKRTISQYWRLTIAVFNIAMFVAANIAPLFICGHFEGLYGLDGLRDDALSHENARRCRHPTYYFHLGAAAACGLVSVSPVGGCLRLALLGALVFAYALPVVMQPKVVIPRPILDCEPYLKPFNVTHDIDETLHNFVGAIYPFKNIIMLLFIVVAVYIIHRYIDALERARFSRGERMRAQAEQAADMRRRNQALIHNVLPAHVARHFMGARHHHRDLYSQSYAEVGVLFASMPNFTEFYSEETVNNQGLECLRFLNEVISDFDLLLEESKYKDIIKIKTISSTYMAASGLNPTRQMQPSDGVSVRWAHLARLVEFALELQRVLAAINEQSFNHFVLRLGVNHGPITAGVIGARKPHYDIWGNTVNVASRMESTGKAGCIQVTEETCDILKNFGYYFEQRGLVAVKGKGQLMTYYLQGKHDTPVQTEKPVEEGIPSDVEPEPSDPLLNRRAPVITATRGSCAGLTAAEGSPIPAGTANRDSPISAVTTNRNSPTPAATAKRDSPTITAECSPAPTAISNRASPTPAATATKGSPTPVATATRGSHVPVDTATRGSPGPGETATRSSPVPVDTVTKGSPVHADTAGSGSPVPVGTSTMGSPVPANTATRGSPAPTDTANKGSPVHADTADSGSPLTTATTTSGSSIPIAIAIRGSPTPAPGGAPAGTNAPAADEPSDAEPEPTEPLLNPPTGLGLDWVWVEPKN